MKNLLIFLELGKVYMVTHKDSSPRRFASQSEAAGLRIKKICQKFLPEGQIFLILLALLVFGAMTTYASDWRRIDLGANTSDAKAVAIDRNNSAIIYAGFKQGLYKIINRGGDWELLGGGLISDINFLLLDNQDSRIIYAATQKGLFRSLDAGGNWQKIFTGKDALERDILGVAILYKPPKTVFIATRSGCFFTPVNRIVWQKVGGKLNDAAILSIIADPANPDSQYIISSKGLFKANERMFSYERIHLGFNPEEEDSETDTDSEEEEGSPQEYFFSHLAADPRNKNNLYLGSLKGLVVSLDRGRSWQRYPLSGLLEERINYILVSDRENRFFLATRNGVFDCRGDSCSQLYKDADFKNCSQLALDLQDNLYAACDKGLYVMPLRDKNAPSALGREAIKNNLYQGQPSIRQVQEEAIKYAEVYPEKISQWRKQARLKAFFPEVDLSYDKTVFTSTSFPQGRGFVGPLDWGVTLKWDVGDLIFNDDQTSIDVRSRLMVQLRDDILNEVTRLYFELKRLQLELSGADILEGRPRVEKELRAQELAASIDGLTGGYFSRSLGEAEE